MELGSHKQLNSCVRVRMRAEAYVPDIRSSRTGNAKPEPWVRRPNRDGERTEVGLGAGMRSSARRRAARTLGRLLGTARYHALYAQHRSPYSR